MAIAQCWLPDQELEVAGELGEVVLLLAGRNTPFPLGKRPLCHLGPGHRDPHATERTPKALCSQERRGVRGAKGEGIPAEAVG